MSIKIPETFSIKHKQFFHDGFISMMIVGSSGCGKTQLLANILPSLSEKIKVIVIATVLLNVPVHNSILNYFNSKQGYRAFKLHDPNDLNEFTFKGSIPNKNGVTPIRADKQGLIIFDDFNRGKEKDQYWSAIVNAFTKYRNLHWNFIIITQQPQFLPTIVRNNINTSILFRCPSKPALDVFTRDIFSTLTNREDREKFRNLVEFVQRMAYHYIILYNNPFELGAGFGSDVKAVISDNQFIIPTYDELMRKMKATSEEEFNSKTRIGQLSAGNTSSKL